MDDRDIKYISTLGLHDQTFLYVFECQGFHKIGYSRNPFGRLEALRTGNPMPIRFKSYWRLPKGYGAEFEKIVHAALAEHRATREWFLVPLADIKLAIRAATKTEPFRSLRPPSGNATRPVHVPSRGTSKKWVYEPKRATSQPRPCFEPDLQGRVGALSPIDGGRAHG